MLQSTIASEATPNLLRKKRLSAELSKLQSEMMRQRLLHAYDKLECMEKKVDKLHAQLVSLQAYNYYE